MTNPIIAAKYDPRVEERINSSDGRYHPWKVASFPYCCGGTVVTGMEAIKNIPLFSAWYTKKGGILFWTQTTKTIEHYPKLRDRLIEAEWISTTFPSRMSGHYTVELWTYVGKEEHLLSGVDCEKLEARLYWPDYQGQSSPVPFKPRSHIKGPDQRAVNQVVSYETTVRESTPQEIQNVVEQAQRLQIDGYF